MKGSASRVGWRGGVPGCLGVSMVPGYYLGCRVCGSGERGGGVRITTTKKMEQGGSRTKLNTVGRTEETRMHNSVERLV